MLKIYLSVSVHVFGAEGQRQRPLRAGVGDVGGGEHGGGRAEAAQLHGLVGGLVVRALSKGQGAQLIQ